MHTWLVLWVLVVGKGLTSATGRRLHSELQLPWCGCAWSCRSGCRAEKGLQIHHAREGPHAVRAVLGRGGAPWGTRPGGPCPGGAVRWGEAPREPRLGGAARWEGHAWERDGAPGGPHPRVGRATRGLRPGVGRGSSGAGATRRELAADGWRRVAGVNAD